MGKRPYYRKYNLKPDPYPELKEFKGYKFLGFIGDLNNYETFLEKKDLRRTTLRVKLYNVNSGKENEKVVYQSMFKGLFFHDGNKCRHYLKDLTPLAAVK